MYKTGYPFFFLLDAAIINAFVASRDLFDHTKIPHLTRQQAFRMRLAWNLVIFGAQELKVDWTRILEFDQRVPTRTEQRQYQEGGFVPTGNNTTSRSKKYIGAFFELLSIQKSPGDHMELRFFDKKKLCAYCRYKRNTLKQDWKVRQTHFGCQICDDDYPLCKACFGSWHSD